jgi:hypothetical protein
VTHALRWAKEAERLGAEEICVNSIDADEISVLSGNWNLDLDANDMQFFAVHPAATQRPGG